MSDNEAIISHEDVTNKIKEMIKGILNENGTFSYTTKMIKDEHKFNEDLNLSKYEKKKLLFQCDEFFKIDLDDSAEEVATVKDLVNMICTALQGPTEATEG